MIEDILNFGVTIKIIKNEEFKEQIKRKLKENKSDVINMLLNDMDKNMNLHYNNNIKVNSEHTVKLLNLYGFNWPKINKNYIKNILNLLKGE